MGHAGVSRATASLLLGHASRTLGNVPIGLKNCRPRERSNRVHNNRYPRVGCGAPSPPSKGVRPGVIQATPRSGRGHDRGESARAENFYPPSPALRGSRGVTRWEPFQPSEDRGSSPQRLAGEAVRSRGGSPSPQHGGLISMHESVFQNSWSRS